MSKAVRLCYITDRHTLQPKPLLPSIVEACDAGVDLIQIREKDLPTRDLLELVGAVVKRTHGTATRVVVNDRLDVALALGAHGVHLGTRSMPAEAVRMRVAQDFLVGVSCHSLEEALAAEAAGVDYVVLGPIFRTASKLAFGPPLGLGQLRTVTSRVKVPVLALGGLTVERVKPCLDAGASGIAGVSLFQECSSLEARVRELRGRF